MAGSRARRIRRADAGDAGENRVAGRLVVVSNRVSVPRARRRGGRRAGRRRAGGLARAWAACGSAGAERTARSRSRRRSVTEKDKITYALLDLSREEHRGYYAGFSNRTLWPIFHYRDRPRELRSACLHHLPRGERALRRSPEAAPARRRPALDPRLPPDPAGGRAAPSRLPAEDRLLPPHPVPGGPGLRDPALPPGARPRPAPSTTSWACTPAPTSSSSPTT